MRTQWCLIFLLGTLLTAQRAGAFEIFNASRLTFPREFDELGMKPMCILYPGEFYQGTTVSRDSLPPEQKIRAAARKTRQHCSHVVIDIETWQPKLPGQRGFSAARNDLLRDNYLQFAKIWKEENAATKLGFYNIPRRPDNYKDLVEDPAREKDYIALQHWLLEPLTGLVDFGVTSAYWKYDSQKRNARWWLLSRSVIISQWGPDIPHYYFVWWRGIGSSYNNSPEAAKAHAWIDSSTWKYILDWMEYHADGVILWSRKGEEDPEKLRGGPILNQQPYDNWSTAKMLREQEARDYSLLIRESQWISDLRERLRRNQ
jgi:hypothetical protein